jgi:hypothetical protein
MKKDAACKSVVSALKVEQREMHGREAAGCNSRMEVLILTSRSVS